MNPFSHARRSGKLVILMVCLGIALSACGDARLGRARALEDRGALAEANELYLDVLADHPDDLASLKGLAVNLVLLRRFDEALPYQERTIAADPRDVQTRVELAFNYLNHQARPDAAVRVFQEAVALDPSPKHRTFLAQSLIASGNTAEARSILLDVMKVDPGYRYASTILRKLEGGQPGGAG